MSDALKNIEKKSKKFKKENNNKKRNSFIVKLTVLASIIIVAVGIIGGTTIYKKANPPLSPKNVTSTGGVLVGKNMNIINNTEASKIKNRMQVYVDYICPYCGKFERSNSTFIKKQINSGNMVLELHPTAFLAISAPGDYSTRAANAALSVANYSPKAFYTFNTLLYDNQPDESDTTGLNNSKILSLVKKALNETYNTEYNFNKIQKSVIHESFKKWITKQTEYASKHKVAGSDNSKAPLQIGTPAIYINHMYFTGDSSNSKKFEEYYKSVEK